MQLRSFHNNALIDSCLLDSAPLFLLGRHVRRRSQAVTDTADSAQSLMSVAAASTAAPLLPVPASLHHSGSAMR